MKGLVRFSPFGLFLALIGVLVWRLVHPADTNVHSLMTNRELPSLTLASARPGQPPLTNAALATGRPQLVNLFGSWCIPCMDEAPQLMRLKREGVSIVGIAVRDRPGAVSAFLERFGDPFGAIGLDPDSRAQLALGSAGVPETFVVDGKGVARTQFIGGLDERSLPMVRRALAEAGK